MNVKIPLHKDKIEHLLNDLRKIGNDKPLGYLPLSTLIEQCGINPYVMREELIQNGLKVIILDHNECSISSGALFAYSEAALQKLLTDNKEVLLSADWPTEAELFIKYLHTVAPRNTALFDLIADAFGDRVNPGRRIK